MAVHSQPGVHYGRMPQPFSRYGERRKTRKLVCNQALRQFVVGSSTRKRQVARFIPPRSDDPRQEVAREKQANLSVFWKTAQSEIRRLYQAGKKEQRLAPLVDGLQRPDERDRGAAHYRATVAFHPAGKTRLRRFPTGYAIAEIHGFDRTFLVIDQRHTVERAVARHYSDLVVVESSNAWT